MQRTMQRHCAVFRDGPLLEKGLRKLDEVIEMMRADLSVTDRSMIFNTDLGEVLGTRQHARPGECQSSFRYWADGESRRPCPGRSFDA